MIIKKGSTGDLVVKVQKLLGLNPDGDFGPNTEGKVKEWQKAKGLLDDGVIGPITWGMMFPGEQIPFPPVTSTELKLSNLQGHLPAGVITQIAEIASKFNINSPLRLAHFLSQCSHESAGFKLVYENLGYSATQLTKFWPALFPASIAVQYGGNPQAIANRAYGNRMGNGPEASGQGWLFRGRGYIQLTGKDNYKQFSDFIGEDCVANPDLVATKYPLASAAFFFNRNGIWSVCDQGSSDAVVTAVTKRVNGGTNGLSHRLAEFKKFLPLLSA
jgi:putative chitinase